MRFLSDVNRPKADDTALADTANLLPLEAFAA